MYSDEQILQIIFMLHEDNDNADALAKIRETTDIRFLNKAIEILQDGIEENYLMAYHIIENLNEIDSTLVLQQILPFMEHPIHGVWAIRRVAGLDVKAVRFMPRFTLHSDAEVRYTALWALEGLNHPEKLEIALFMLNDESAKIRAKACRMLSVQGYSTAVESLVARLSDSEISPFERPVGAEAAKALGAIMDESAIIPLQEAVRSGEEALANAALEALASIDCEASEEFFLQQINHRFDSVRMGLINCIGSFGSSYVDILIAISQNDPSYYVQKKAAGCLATFVGTPEARAAALYWGTHYKHKDDDELF